MYIVKIYVIRERKRSAPMQKLLRREIVPYSEVLRTLEEYGDDPSYIVTVIKAYKGAK
jgi:hypothetical protein